jgi:hypothetical protein
MLIMTRDIIEKSRGLPYLIVPILLSVSLASCYPEFKNPIPPPAELKADPQILGTWYLTNQSDSKMQMFIFQRSNGWIDLVSIENIDSKESNDGITVSIMEGYSTFINEQKFLCLRLRKRDFSNPDIEKIKEFPFLIFNYETPSKDELDIKLFSLEKVKELIKAGKLKGEIVTEDALKNDVLGLLFKRVFTYERIIVTASSDELKEAIAKEGVEAFLASSSDELAKAFSEIGWGSFVGQDKIFVFPFSRNKP